MAHILVVEDERPINQLICRSLSLVGHLCEPAYSGQEARACSEEKAFDLAILDVMLPDTDGFALYSLIKPIPAIFVTARGALTDRLKGLNMGADDYIVKPFSNAELLMRIRAILRRSTGFSVSAASQTPKNQLTFQDLILDLDSQSVLKGETVISLTYTEFKILELLVTHKKKIYSLDNIYQSIWEDGAVGDSAIMVHIKNIRKKLGDNSRNPVYIKTAWGRGYYID